VHCECVLLAELHSFGSVFDCIDVSKPSCVYHSNYFAAYRTTAPNIFSTRGTHGDERTLWAYLSLPSAAKPLSVERYAMLFTDE
jgi:hypothetical protein